ncbi:hypothetical protein [Rectinema subterraneum]|jgi:hypothetical protein|uniref:hypothetical protein n=1 Tax=Rectinema subterraneum TaxID=2653714 RepID=UPI00131C7097|nr:hypothetical protein [Rectinema subterraneum]
MRRFRRTCIWLLLMLVPFLLSAQTRTQGVAAKLSFEIGAGAVLNEGSYGEEIENRGLSPNGFAAFSFDAGFLGFTGKLSANTDGKYAPFLADNPSGTLGNIYFLMDEGGFFSQLGPVTLKAGRFRNFDYIDSPYSLFINSNGISAPTASIAYEGPLFFFETRWIGLTIDSWQKTDAWPSGFPDRAMNLHVFGIRRGDMRIGFQEATVYSGSRYFDYEYFLNPLPQIFTQYVRGQGGAPWSSDYDDNYVMGFFVNVKKPGKYNLIAQAFIDDMGMFGIAGWTNNPWQVALTLGASVEKPSGTWAFNIAGATKYTFAPSTMRSGTESTLAYGYTYFPDTRFDIGWNTAGFQPKAIATEDNMIGYKYGENNLALELSWNKAFPFATLASAFEFRLAGSNSPTNPWQDLTYDPQSGFEWLNDPVLEKRFLLSLGGEKSAGPWLFSASLTGGIALDALELRPPNPPTGGWPAGASLVDQKSYIFAPVAGNTKPLFRLTLGIAYRFFK